MNSLRPKLLLVILFSFAIPVVADDEPSPTSMPSKSPKAAIVRFVEECVQLPVEGNLIPATVSVGTANPAKHELPLRATVVSQRFRISKYETTQELYQAVMGENPSRWKGPRNSVENVSYRDAEHFCRKLTAMLHHDRKINTSEVVRLPTTVEWEYCCRAGSSTRYSFGDEPGLNGGTNVLDAYAWHTGNAAGNDPAVGILKPNGWQLYDVHGYLWEFVSDVAPDQSTKPTSLRMARGGSWKDDHSRLSSSSYLTLLDDATSDAVGFRCVIAEKPAVKNDAGR